MSRPHTHELAGGLVHHRWVRLDDADHPQALAREQIRQALAGRASSEIVDDALTVVSELVANAIAHTSSGPLGMFLDVYEDVAVMWIYDGGNDLGSVILRAPQPVPCGDLPENGRGLYLVDLLAAKWFVWPTDEGKAVVAAVDLTPADSREQLRAGT
jgi:anti-sigma regulatory factor (Ser/Thr protein kinase)